MTIEDYSVRSGTVKVWFSYNEIRYTVILHTANASNLIEGVIESKDDWVKMDTE